MTESYRQHAEQIVETFKRFLSPELVESISDEQFDELSMLIESAISAAVLQHIEDIADRFGSLAATVRKEAERYDATGRTIS
jgi:hypothetical protein